MARYDWTDGDIATAARLDGLPGGVMGYVNGSTSNQSGITSSTDISGLSVTWTAESARLYRTTVFVSLTQASADATISLRIASGADATVVLAQQGLANGGNTHMSIVSLETGLSGSTTRKGKVAASAGSVTVNGSSSRFPTIIVEDLGLA